MCNSCSVNLNSNEIEAFGGKLLEVVNNAGLAMMISIGHRVGLFDAMAGGQPHTCKEISNKSEANERYVREWLGAMVTGGIVLLDDTNSVYSLPLEHAALLTRNSPDNIASTMQWISVLGEVESEIVECFKQGGGVPYSRYSRFHEVMAEESDSTTVENLLNNILPLDEELTVKLQNGIDVLDVGCGRGKAMIYLAQQFPNSRFTGIDLCDETIDWARNEKDRLGLSNVSFEKRNAAELAKSDAFDLITAFDAIHDQAKPADVLGCVANLLRKDGVFLMQDIQASSNVSENIGKPLAPFLYTVSCMHCMSVSLSQNGAGLGAVWGKELANSMLGDAGFSDVKVHALENDILNYYYVAKVAA